MKSKVNLTLLIAISFLATSITLFDFDNPEWYGNEKSYIGFAAGIILFILGKRK